MDENASMSPAKEAHGKGRKIDHAARLARQGGGSGIDHAAGLARQGGGSSRGAAARTLAAVGGKSARNTVPAALQSPDSDHEFAELSRARPAVAKRTISGMKCIHSCCTAYTRVRTHARTYPPDQA